MIHRGKEYRPGFIPEEVYEALEDGNITALRAYARDIPALKYLLR